MIFYKKYHVWFWLISLFILFALLNACELVSTEDEESTVDSDSEWDSQTETQLTIHDVNTDYRIEKIRDQWYLIFEDERLYDVKSPPGFFSSSLFFDSEADFITAFTKKDALKLEEIEYIALHFPRDGIGIKLFDVDRFCIPVFPESLTYHLETETEYYIRWSGEQYTWDLEDRNQKDDYYSITVYTKKQFESLCDPSEFPKAGESSSDGMRGTLQQNDMTLYMQKRELYGRAQLDIYGVENDGYFRIRFEGNDFPSDDFWLSFGLTPYVAEPME